MTDYYQQRGAKAIEAVAAELAETNALLKEVVRLLEYRAEQDTAAE